MPVPYPNIHPYEVLGVDKNATPLEIKKAYKKLSLKYHPDKLRQASREEEDPGSEMFQKIQFSYSILSDINKRSRYDNTGSVEDYGEEEYFDWKSYFDTVSQGISVEMIEEDKKKYQNSQEEKDDILNNFAYYEGDFLKLFEVIPHLEFTESEEVRIYNIIEENMRNLGIPSDSVTFKTWAKYKKSRKTKVKQMLKKLSKEAKEAAELDKKIAGKKLKTVNDLRSLIQSKQSARLDDLVNKLESKYADKKGKKRKKSIDDIDEEEFQRIQSKLKK